MWFVLISLDRDGLSNPAFHLVTLLVTQEIYEIIHCFKSVATWKPYRLWISIIKGFNFDIRAIWLSTRHCYNHRFTFCISSPRAQTLKYHVMKHKLQGKSTKSFSWSQFKVKNHHRVWDQKWLWRKSLSLMPKLLKRKVQCLLEWEDDYNKERKKGDALGQVDSRRGRTSWLTADTPSQIENNKLAKIRRDQSPFSILEGSSHNLKPQVIKQTFQILRILYQWK